jgi:hypothetical protein
MIVAKMPENADLSNEIYNIFLRHRIFRLAAQKSARRRSARTLPFATT